MNVVAPRPLLAPTTPNADSTPYIRQGRRFIAGCSQCSRLPSLDWSFAPILQASLSSSRIIHGHETTLDCRAQPASLTDHHRCGVGDPTKWSGESRLTYLPTSVDTNSRSAATNLVCQPSTAAEHLICCIFLQSSTLPKLSRVDHDISLNRPRTGCQPADGRCVGLDKHHGYGLYNA